jgi:ParB family chromosome partitioning protein
MSNMKKIDTQKPARVKAPAINFSAAYDEIDKTARETTESRFERATRVVSQQPSALSAAASHAKATPETYEIGKVYQILVSLIDPNPVGVRHYYKASEVDRIGATMRPEGQKVAANGFVKPNGRIELIDGGTRLKSAKSEGLETLEVKIEKPPADLREQYKRSKQLNEERSDHTALDTAVLYKYLLDQGVYASQDDLAADMQDRKGNPMSKAQVSMYMRIEKIPDRLRRQMIEHDQTSGFHVAYEISSIFVRPDYEERREEYERIAEEVIKEIQDKGLGKLQAQALVASKFKGKQTRTRGTATTVKYGDKNGVIKTVEGRGQLDFSIKGLDPERLKLLQDGIERLCAGQLPL